MRHSSSSPPSSSSSRASVACICHFRFQLEMARLVLLPLLVTLFLSRANCAYICVCKSTAVSQQQMQAALDYACGNGADCSLIQPGKLCYTADLTSRCSFAVNSYYQNHFSNPDPCNFAGAATLLNLTASPPDGCTLPSDSSVLGNPSYNLPPPPPPPSSLLPTSFYGPPPERYYSPGTDGIPNYQGGPAYDMYPSDGGFRISGLRCFSFLATLSASLWLLPFPSC